MKRQAYKRWASLAAAIFLLLCFAAAAYLSWRTSEYVYDADASSELILAELLNEEGGILSGNWYYSTELRVLNTQLVYAPLFSVFSSWRMVRFVGSVILQAILVLSFLFAARQTGIQLPVRLFFAGLLLLPVSVTHAQTLLMHSYYVPHVSIGFVLLGLLLTVIDAEKKRLLRVIGCFVFLLLSFLSGLGGVRQLMVSFLPMLLAEGLLLLTERETAPILKKIDGADAVQKGDLFALLSSRAGGGFFVTVLGAFSACVGYLVNSRILAARYSFFSFEQTTLLDLLPERVFTGLSGILRLFGYRGANSTLMMSVTGIFALLGIVCCVAAVAFALRLIGNKGACETYEKRLFGSLFLTSAIVMLFIQTLTNRTTRTMYFIPAYVFSIGTLTVLWEGAKMQRRRFLRILSVCIVLAMAGNAALTARYFISYHCGESARMQSAITYDDYEGHVDDVRELRGAVDYLVENGYEYGYASFWNGNLCTEMTDGALRTVNVHIREDGFQLYRWLMRKDTVDAALAAERPFLLVSLEEKAKVLDNGLLSEDRPMQIVYEDAYFAVFAAE